MARTQITAQTIALAGITPAVTVGQVDGHFFANPASNARYGTRFARVTNTGAVSRNITFQTGATVEGIAIEEITVAVPAGSVRLIGPFSPRTFNRPGDVADPATVYVDYDAAAPTELSIEIYEFPVS